MAEQEQQDKFKQNRSGWVFANRGRMFGFAIVVMYFFILGMTVWFENTAMFCAVFAAGALAGLPALVRSFQKRNGGTSANIERQQNN